MVYINMTASKLSLKQFGFAYRVHAVTLLFKELTWDDL